MFFERLFKKKEGQTIERVEASPMKTIKTVDAATESVLITDEQKHDHDFRVTLTYRIGTKITYIREQRRNHHGGN